MKYALVAAVFIAIRDVFSSKIARKYKIPIIPMQNQRIADDKFLVTFFEPIDDFGMANAGCTYIKINGEVI